MKKYKLFLEPNEIFMLDDGAVISYGVKDVQKGEPAPLTIELITDEYDFIHYTDVEYEDGCPLHHYPEYYLYRKDYVGYRRIYVDYSGGEYVRIASRT